MQLTIGKFLIAFCLIQAFKPESLIWAQDAPATSLEVTTQINSGEDETTDKPLSSEILAPSSESLEDETTTVTPPNDCDDSTNKSSGEKCECKCDEETTTTSPNTSEEDTTTIANEDDKSKNTTLPTEESNEESSGDGSSDSTTSTEASTTLTPASTSTPEPSFTCTTSGNFAHPNNCNRYYSCYQPLGSENLELVEYTCPEGQAFNPVFSTCLRDLSTCSRDEAGFECLEAGSFADPQNDNSSYFRCVPHLGGEVGSFHLYHVKCGDGKIYMPQLGKCFIDFSKPLTGFLPNFNGMPDDEQLVKAEIKQWKLKEKSQLKQEKLKSKYEKKLQKELAKKAAKEAKEKAKQEAKAKKEKEGKKDKNFSFDDDE